MDLPICNPPGLAQWLLVAVFSATSWWIGWSQRGNAEKRERQEDFIRDFKLRNWRWYNDQDRRD